MNEASHFCPIPLKFNFMLYKKVYKPVLLFCFVFFFNYIFTLLTHDEFHTWFNLPR